MVWENRIFTAEGRTIFFSLCSKVHSKCMEDFNLTHEISKLIRENRGDTSIHSHRQELSEKDYNSNRTVWNLKA